MSIAPDSIREGVFEKHVRVEAHAELRFGRYASSLKRVD